MSREYYRVIRIEDNLELAIRSYYLSPHGLDDPNSHVAGLSLVEGDIPISLEDDDKIYTIRNTVHLWITAEQTTGKTAIVYLRGATNAA